jgi:hypothetical protein
MDTLRDVMATVPPERERERERERGGGGRGGREKWRVREREKGGIGTSSMTGVSEWERDRDIRERAKDGYIEKRNGNSPARVKERERGERWGRGGREGREGTGV